MPTVGATVASALEVAISPLVYLPTLTRTSTIANSLLSIHTSNQSYKENYESTHKEQLAPHSFLGEDSQECGSTMVQTR
jgi:hypothetical protein